MREKCPYLEFFLSVCRLNTDQKYSKYGHFLRSVRFYEELAKAFSFLKENFLWYLVI